MWRVDPTLTVHVILDNLSAHKSPLVKRWVARHPRFQFHFMPTYSAWLNLVERFFGLLTEHALKRGSHSSTHALRHAISAYVDAHNDEGKPFKWTKTADEKFYADMRQRYFGSLASRYRGADEVIHIVLILFSGATFIGSASGWTSWIITGLAIMAFVLAAAATVLHLSVHSATFAEFSVAWGKLHDEYRMLWASLSSGSIEPEAARSRLLDLMERAEPIDRQTTAYKTQRTVLNASYDDALEATKA